LAHEYAAKSLPTVQDFVAAAAWSGWLHDVGKYRPEFQLMMRGLRAKGEATRHKQAGAAWAADAGRRDVAFVIAGHHGGLPDPEELKSLIIGPGGRDIAREIRDVAAGECPKLAEALPKWAGDQDPLKFDLWVRLLFSCLVDADWQDTGNHERRANAQPPLAQPPELTGDLAERLSARVRGYIEHRAAQCREANAGVVVPAERSVPAIRAQILEAALAAAAQPPGLFSLTVPTGGAKTLTALAFALDHARRHGLRRVIYVAPYLSILEQNAREIRRALQAEMDSPDAELVFEHHSLAEPPAGPDREETQSEAAARQAQNWSAPFVITTNVQFFESLFSNQPGACRKLHNIARSVVILDECQTLPPGVVEPTCSMLKAMAEWAGTTIVLCTATQPAWSKRPDWPTGLENVREIAPPELNLFQRLQRVTVHWSRRQNPPLDWPDVASMMLEQRAALCIVNTKRAARSVFEHLREQGGESVFHLSTAMCPAHRLAVLDEVRERLRREKRCHVISTQLIEAGVDVDFPFVLRELAPLEAIVQSAGRCNREGRLNGPDGSPGGHVIVFRSVDGRLPRGDRWYEAGRGTLEAAFLNAGRDPDISAPQDMLEYFRRLYATGTLDVHGIEDLRRRLRFRVISEGHPDDKGLGRYRLIDDVTFPAVVATWDAHRQTVERLLANLRESPTPRAFRELGRFQVNLRHYELAQLGQLVVTEAHATRVWRGKYDEQLGLLPEMDDVELIV
jgi:CRISPR-associated endonuclease/helicase Cas3